MDRHGNNPWSTSPKPPRHCAGLFDIPTMEAQMRIISDARRVVILSYSFWAQVLGLAALILPEVAYALWGIETDPYVLWWIGVGLLAFGIVGRLVVQTGPAIVNALRIAVVAVLIV